MEGKGKKLNEEKIKRIVVASTVGAVFLIVILFSIMSFLVVRVIVEKKKYNELCEVVAQYKLLDEEAKKTYEARSTRWWIETRARELGYVYDGDEIIQDN